MFSGGRDFKTKGGIKLHTLFDITTQIPAFIHITPAAVNDMNAMDYISYEEGAYSVFDRGYVDFLTLNTISQRKAFFVILAKSSLKYHRIYSAKVDKSTGVLCDQTGKLTGFNTSEDYPEILRRVKYYDKESNRTFVFLTNNMEITASSFSNGSNSI